MLQRDQLAREIGGCALTEERLHRISHHGELVEYSPLAIGSYAAVAIHDSDSAIKRICDVNVAAIGEVGDALCGSALKRLAYRTETRRVRETRAPGCAYRVLDHFLNGVERAIERWLRAFDVDHCGCGYRCHSAARIRSRSVNVGSVDIFRPLLI